MENETPKIVEPDTPSAVSTSQIDPLIAEVFTPYLLTKPTKDDSRKV